MYGGFLGAPAILALHYFFLSRLQEIELLAEPIKMLLRKYQVENSDEKMKSFTRGKTLDQAAMHAFVLSLGLPQEAQDTLRYYFHRPSLARSLPSGPMISIRE